MNDELFMQESEHVLRLRTRAYNSLEQWFNERVSVISLKHEDFSETKCAKQDTEDFPNIPLSVKGTQIAIFFFPLPGPTLKIRISLRSRPDTPITALQIAEHFGGGGHEHSAGAIYYGTINEAKEAVKLFILGNISNHG